MTSTVKPCSSQHNDNATLDNGSGVESPFRGETNSRLVHLPLKERGQQASAYRHLYPTTVRQAQQLRMTPYPADSLFLQCLQHHFLNLDNARREKKRRVGAALQQQH